MDDAFCDIVTDLGIMVWNDFMFTSGTYPAHFDFRQKITTEAEDNVKGKVSVSLHNAGSGC